MPETQCTTTMPTLIARPTRVEAAGNKPKLIDEFVGRVNTGDTAGEHRAHAKPRRLGRARSERRSSTNTPSCWRAYCVSSIATA